MNNLDYIEGASLRWQVEITPDDCSTAVYW